MAFTHVKDIVAVTGTYMKNGEEKRNFKNVGRVMKGDDGSSFLLLDASFNPAGVPRKDGSDSITLSLYDPKPKDGQQPQQAPRSAPAAASVHDDGLIPF